MKSESNNSDYLAKLSQSQKLQQEIEEKVFELFKKSLIYKKEKIEQNVDFSAKAHLDYLISGLKFLPSSYASLDSSRIQILYQILHSIDLLVTNELDCEPMMNDKIMFGIEKINEKTIHVLEKCQINTENNSAFGGGFYQASHLATTYAGIATIFSIGTKQAFNLIDRQKVYAFLMSLKCLSGHNYGGFYIHKGGEVDMRATYTAISSAAMLNILTDELVEGVVEYIAACQTYQGGIGGEPYTEAHGGYSYCGFATLCILDRTDVIDTKQMMKQLVFRQMEKEGGFQGRTNKLVDSCYSFWVGALAILLQQDNKNRINRDKSEKTSQSLKDNKRRLYIDSFLNTQNLESNLCNFENLNRFILICCQKIEFGGFSNRPFNKADYYHTCYGLSGMSLAMQINKDSDNNRLKNFKLRPTSVLFNVEVSKLQAGLNYFSELPDITLLN